MYSHIHISENSRKLYVTDLANNIHCNIPPDALMNTVSSYEAAYWLEWISYNFLIWCTRVKSQSTPRIFKGMDQLVQYSVRFTQFQDDHWSEPLNVSALYAILKKEITIYKTILSIKNWNLNYILSIRGSKLTK